MIANNKIGNHAHDTTDITVYIKEWMFKSFKDEAFIQIQKDYESGLIKKYEDPYFPPNNDSLGQKIVKKFKDLIWQRAPEFIENVQILNLETEQKVNQGRIGDCYLLNPIGLLGLIQKNMIARLFTIKKPNNFGVWLFIDGKWQYITVDESFPWWITRKKPYFCDIVDVSQIWAMIIEKAWAKLHGEYSRLWGGDTGLAFRVITGAPTKSYGLKKYRKDPRKKDYVYKQIEYHLSQGHLISVTTGALDDYGKSIMTQGHSYALIGYKKEENKYIIRDPRGPTNVFGREIYEIEQDQLIYLFQCVIVCLLHSNYLFTQHELKFEEEQLKSEKLFKIKLEKKMKFHLSFFQPNKRFFKSSEKGKKHKLSKMTVKVLKIDSKEGQIIKAKTISQRNGKMQQMDLEINLNRGSYYIYCLLEWNSTEHRQINICSYGSHFIEFIDLPSDKKLNQLKEFLEVQRMKREEQKKTKKNDKNTKYKIQQGNITNTLKIENSNTAKTETISLDRIQTMSKDTIQTRQIDKSNTINIDLIQNKKMDQEVTRMIDKIESTNTDQIQTPSIERVQTAYDNDKVNIDKAIKSQNDRIEITSSDKIQINAKDKKQQNNKQDIIQQKKNQSDNVKCVTLKDSTKDGQAMNKVINSPSNLLNKLNKMYIDGSSDTSNKIKSNDNLRNERRILEAENTNPLKNQITINTIQVPTYLAKRNQIKSKTLISQKRYSLNRSQNRNTPPNSELPIEILNEQIKYPSTVKYNQKQDHIPISHRQLIKKNPQTIQNERRSIKGPLQSSTIIKQDQPNNQNQLQPQTMNTIPPSSILTYKLKEGQQENNNSKGYSKLSKEQINQKLLPPICPSPKMKHYMSYKHSYQKSISQTEQKISKQEQIQLYSDNKSNSIVQSTIKAATVVDLENNNNSSNQQLQNKQKNQQQSFQTPLKNMTNNMISNVNLFNQFTEYKSETSHPIKEKQNQGIIYLNQRINKSLSYKRQQMRVLNLQKANV